MSAALRFEGLKGRAVYLTASLAVFFSQHLVVLGVNLTAHQAIPRIWWFWINPFRALLLSSTPNLNTPVLVLGMVATCLADAVLLWLAFRRGRNSTGGGWIASLAVVPGLQLGVIGLLALVPDQPQQRDALDIGRKGLDAKIAAQGLMVVRAGGFVYVALSALFFHLYGYVLFLAAPFLIATAVSYLANRDGFIGAGRTFSLVFSAFLLGGAALMGFAFEGFVCLLLAGPLVAIMGLLGTSLGLALVKVRRPGRGTTLSSIAIIPILLAGEAVLPPHAAFDRVESVDVAASPAAVWDAVVLGDGADPDALAALFRWGLAYPDARRNSGCRRRLD